jgi:hypothetical protein
MPDEQNAPEETPAPEVTELKPGYIVFFDAPVFGEEDQVHVGLVIHAADGRVRVKPLGLASESADFPSDAVRLSA